MVNNSERREWTHYDACEGQRRERGEVKGWKSEQRGGNTGAAPVGAGGEGIDNKVNKERK